MSRNGTPSINVVKVATRTRNAIHQRVDSIVRDHGRAETYTVLQRWCSAERDRSRLAKEAARLERELREVNRKARAH